MKNLLYIFIATVLFSCDEVPQADVSGVIIEKRNRKLQKVSKGDIMEKAMSIGQKQIEDNVAALVTPDDLDKLIPVEKEIISMYIEASKEKFEGNNIQFYNDDKWVLYNEPLYQNNEFRGVYSIKLEVAEVIKQMQ